MSEGPETIAPLADIQNEMMACEEFIERIATEIAETMLEQCRIAGPGMAACALRTADIIRNLVLKVREDVRKPKDGADV